MERPILFSAPMVRAILDGRKTQTRRIVNPQPRIFTPEHDRQWHVNAIPPGGCLPEHWSWWEGPAHGQSCYHTAKCPYGAPGDHLWVRETWGIHSKSWTYYGWEYDGLIEFSTKTPREDLICNGSHKIREVAYAAHGYEPCREGGEAGWKPSIHMPRWASRITLEVVSVKVERLQDISEDDALAEGIFIHNEGTAFACCHDYLDNESRSPALFKPVDSFCTLWESINGERSWDANPWVWVVEFGRVEADQPTAMRHPLSGPESQAVVAQDDSLMIVNQDPGDQQ